MNQIGELLEASHTTQKAFVKELKIPHLDSPLFSKIKLGIVNPTPHDAQLIADHLGKPLNRVWHVSDLTYHLIAREPYKATERMATADTHKLKVAVRCRIEPETKEQLRKHFEADGFTTEQAFLRWLIMKYINKKSAVSANTTAQVKIGYQNYNTTKEIVK